MVVTSAFLRDGDGHLGAVRHGEAGALLLTRRDRAVADDLPLPEVIRLEHERGERIAPAVALAALFVDVHLHGSPPSTWSVVTTITRVIDGPKGAMCHTPITSVAV